MKTTFKTLLCTSLMLAFITGCGKEQKSGAAAPAAPIAPLPVVAPIVNNVNTTGAEAMANATAWYNSTTESSSVIGPKTEVRQIQLVNQNNCKTKEYLGFINIQTCFGSNTGNVTTESRVVYVIANPVKSSNAKLVPVFSPAAGLTLVGTTQNQTLISIDYAKANGHIIRYKLDLSLNSAFNPVEIYDTELGRLEFVANPSQLR